MGVKLLFSVWKVLHWLEIQLLFVIEGIGATPFLTAKVLSFRLHRGVDP